MALATPKQQKAFYETEFNVKLTGSMLIELLWHSQQFKENHPRYWDYKDADYCQAYCDEFMDMRARLREPHQNFTID